MSANDPLADLRALRNETGLNQKYFWGRVGVSQSVGSRYESGRKMSKPVRELVRLVYVEYIDIERINRTDWEVAEYFRRTDKEGFYAMAREARKHRGRGNSDVN